MFIWIFIKIKPQRKERNMVPVPTDKWSCNFHLTWRPRNAYRVCIVKITKSNQLQLLFKPFSQSPIPNSFWEMTELPLPSFVLKKILSLPYNFLLAHSVFIIQWMIPLYHLLSQHLFVILSWKIQLWNKTPLQKKPLKKCFVPFHTHSQSPYLSMNSHNQELLQGLPWWSSGKESSLQCWGKWVWSLVRELRSHMPRGN